MEKSTLDIAQEIIKFAKTLSTDQELLSESLGIARHSISSDFLASRRKLYPYANPESGLSQDAPLV